MAIQHERCSGSLENATCAHRGLGMSYPLVCKATVPNACPQNNTDMGRWQRRTIPRDVRFKGIQLYPALRNIFPCPGVDEAVNNCICCLQLLCGSCSSMGNGRQDGWQHSLEERKKNKNQTAEEATYFPLLCVILLFFILE